MFTAPWRLHFVIAHAQKWQLLSLFTLLAESMCVETRRSVTPQCLAGGVQRANVSVFCCLTNLRSERGIYPSLNRTTSYCWGGQNMRHHVYRGVPRRLKPSRGRGRPCMQIGQSSEKSICRWMFIIAITLKSYTIIASSSLLPARNVRLSMSGRDECS